jgi:hypothetical protein
MLSVAARQLVDDDTKAIMAPGAFAGDISRHDGTYVFVRVVESSAYINTSEKTH